MGVTELSRDCASSEAPGPLASQSRGMKPTRSQRDHGGSESQETSEGDTWNLSVGTSGKCAKSLSSDSEIMGPWKVAVGSICGRASLEGRAINDDQLIYQV
ncbi:unnamed protein product [Phytophthora fragariaefolia]|uniref:Unnamed protein product n=1 Tax=Phytophthora fragariaefolia TaxID=1490495 RepID=A0A9W6TRG9_9STRA|nr:unnamed protein product [Phytophthora fragariaefolia]